MHKERQVLPLPSGRVLFLCPLRREHSAGTHLFWLMDPTLPNRFSQIPDAAIASMPFDLPDIGNQAVLNAISVVRISFQPGCQDFLLVSDPCADDRDIQEHEKE